MKNPEFNKKSILIFKNWDRINKGSWYLDNKLGDLNTIVYYHGLYKDDLDHLYLEVPLYKTTIPFEKCNMHKLNDKWNKYHDEYGDF